MIDISHFIDKSNNFCEGIISKETAGQNNESRRIPRSANNWFLAFLQLFALWNTTCCGRIGWTTSSSERLDVGFWGKFWRYVCSVQDFQRASRLTGYTVTPSSTKSLIAFWFTSVSALQGMWVNKMCFLNTYQSINQSIHPSIHQSIHPSIYVSIYIYSHNLVQEQHSTSLFCSPAWIWHLPNHQKKNVQTAPTLHSKPQGVWQFCMGFGSLCLLSVYM